MSYYCDEDIEIHGFGGYGHYESTLSSINNNVMNGYFTRLSENQYEIIFLCNGCNSIWKLGKPDFPITGYWIKDINN